MLPSSCLTLLGLLTLTPTVAAYCHPGAAPFAFYLQSVRSNEWALNVPLTAGTNDKAIYAQKFNASGGRAQYTLFWNATSRTCALTLAGYESNSTTDFRSLVANPPGTFNPGPILIAKPYNVKSERFGDPIDVACSQVQANRLRCAATNGTVVLDRVSVVNGTLQLGHAGGADREGGTVYMQPV